MTIREHLTGRKRRATWIAYAGVVVMVLALVPVAVTRNLNLVFAGLMLAGVLVAAVAVGLSDSALRCPRCRSKIGELLRQGGGPFSIPATASACPVCGVDLDTPVTAQDPVEQTEEPKGSPPRRRS